jgi:hypothetical protein
LARNRGGPYTPERGEAGRLIEARREGRLLGHVAWGGATATSERVLIRAGVLNRRLLDRNPDVRIQDGDGVRHRLCRLSLRER